MWSDNETDKDLLGFKVHANLIKGVIANERILPVSVGIFGDWGSGKSSIMKMLEQELNSEGQEDTACIYFNGWAFEGYIHMYLSNLWNVSTENVEQIIDSNLKRIIQRIK